MSHTPGPWAVVVDPMYKDLSVVAYETHTVADAIVIEDDAHLIAAAPELLEALKAVLAAEMIYTGADCETLESSGQFPHVFAFIRAAIAKAEGK